MDETTKPGDPFELFSQWAQAHCSPEPPWRRRVVEETHKNLRYADMLCGSSLAGLLNILVGISGATHVLELGTFTGYSALAMAEALPDSGRLITIDSNLRYVTIARKCFNLSPYADKIDSIHGTIAGELPKLEHRFDLIFLDADKQRYPQYYEMLKPMIKPGGLLVADNVFWHGEVIENSTRKARALSTFVADVMHDPEMTTFVLTVRDGVLIARKQNSQK